MPRTRTFTWLPRTRLNQLLRRQYRRTHEPVLAGRQDQARTNRVLNDVSRDVEHVVTISEHTLEVTFLPQSGTELRMSHERGTLFRKRDECTQVRTVRSAFHHMVDMVRHEAVRENGQLELNGSTQELLVNRCHDRRICEVMASFERLDREEYCRGPVYE